MMVLNKETVLNLHKLIIEETGGSFNVRDVALLESAIASPFITFDGVDLYVSTEEKGAKLGYSLISNHAFIDGNKRIGILAMLVFLELNGIKIETNNHHLVDIVLNVASGVNGYKDLLEWIHKHKFNNMVN